MGSVIAIVATNRRNRIQPIGAQKEIMPFINRQIEGSASKAEILLTLNGQKSSFSNLTLARITLENSGNRDYEEFKFGITISDLSMAVFLQADTQDRYHEILANQPIDLNHWDNEIDFSLKPFNRNDVYSVVLFIKPHSDAVPEIELATKHPVRFVELSAYRGVATSILLEILKSMPLIGPSTRTFSRIRELF